MSDTAAMKMVLGDVREAMKTLEESRKTFRKEFEPSRHGLPTAAEAWLYKYDEHKRYDLLPAALISLMQESPDALETFSLQTALMLSSLARVVPTEEMLGSLYALKAFCAQTAQGMQKGGTESKEKMQATLIASEQLFDCFYHGLLHAQHDDYDDFLRREVASMQETLKKAANERGWEEGELERALVAVRIMEPPAPGTPDLRAPLPDWKLPALDLGWETWKTSLLSEEPSLYAVTRRSFDHIQNLRYIHDVVEGKVPEPQPGGDVPPLDQFPVLLETGVLAKSLTLGDQLIRALWADYAIRGDSKAVARVATMAGAWEEYGGQTLYQTGGDSEGQVLERSSDEDTIGLEAILQGPPVDGLTPFQSREEKIENAAHVTRCSTGRIASWSLIANARRHLATLPSLLVELEAEHRKAAETETPSQSTMSAAAEGRPPTSHQVSRVLREAVMPATLRLVEQLVSEARQGSGDAEPSS